jgi:hypothetical protein
MSARTEFYPSEYLDFLWEFYSAFLQIFRSTGVQGNLESLVQGPLCRECQFSLVDPLQENFQMRISRETLARDYNPVNIIADPCPCCGHKVEWHSVFFGCHACVCNHLPIVAVLNPGPAAAKLLK